MIILQNPGSPASQDKAAAALRRAADTVEACAIGERADAIIVLLARAAERAALGTLCEDEVRALMVMVRG